MFYTLFIYYFIIIIVRISSEIRFYFTKISLVKCPERMGTEAKVLSRTTVQNIQPEKQWNNDMKAFYHT